ncbi:MAG: hypothetical protein ACM3WU_03670 [Bacillota bacterium]
MLEKLLNIDRRIIYVLVAVLVALPLIKPIGLPFSVTAETEKAFAAVDRLSADDVAVFGFDYEAGGAAEVHPQAVVFFDHLMQKGVRVIACSISQQGPVFANQAWEKWANQGKVYGTDFVNLGFFAGGEPALASFAKDIPGFVGTDYMGQATAGQPIFEGVATAADIDLFVDIATGSILPYIQYFQGPFKKPLTGGAIGSQISRYQSYSDSKQIEGYLGSLRGAAEYEKLLGVSGKATASMDAQSAAHLLIAVLIVVGNVAEIIVKKQKATKGAN